MSRRRMPASDPAAAARMAGLLVPAGWTPPGAVGEPGPRTWPDADPPDDGPPDDGPPDDGPPDDGPPDDGPPDDGPTDDGRAADRSPGLQVLPSALDRWRSGRVDPGRRGVAALALVAVLAAALAGFVVLRGRPREVTPPPVVTSGVPVPGSSAGAGAQPAPTGDVVVSVGGLVARPGLVTLPPGSRVADAVTGAGGALPGTDVGLLNLARRVVDGEQVLVGVAAPPGAPPGGGTGGRAPGDGQVDLNTATAAELDALPGIGPVLAQRIVDWRTENGRFGSVDQLREVGGIGESKFADVKAKVRV